MTVGDRLKQLREAEGLTLEAAGEIAGTSKQSTSQIEKGITKVPGGLYLYKWSRHYGVSLEWLITGKGKPKPVQSQSQPERPSGATIAAAVELSRKSLLEVEDETFDPEVDGEIIAQAYMYLLARGQTKVVRSNVLDFAKALKKRQADDGIKRARGTGQTGGAGGGTGQTGSKTAAKTAANRAR